MRAGNLRGPKPLVIGGAVGLGLGVLHGLMVALQTDTNAPVIEGARGWFIGVCAMMALMVATGSVSDAPRGTSPIGHFLAWSVGLQRFLIAFPIAILIAVIVLSTMSLRPGSTAYSLASLGTLVVAGLASVVLQKMLKAIHEMYPRTPEAQAELARQRTEFYARLRGGRRALRQMTQPAGEPVPLTLDELMQCVDEPDKEKRREWAIAHGFDPDKHEALVQETLERERLRREELLAEADAYAARGYRDPDDEPAPHEPVEAVENDVISPKTDRSPIGEVQKPGPPTYLDEHGRLKLPDELANGGDLPPIT